MRMNKQIAMAGAGIVLATLGIVAREAGITLKGVLDPDVENSSQTPNSPTQATAKGVDLQNNVYWREAPRGGFAYYAKDERPDAGDRKWMRISSSPCLMRPKGLLGSLCRVNIPLLGVVDAPIGVSLPGAMFTVNLGCMQVPCSVMWGEESIMPGSDAGLMDQATVKEVLEATEVGQK